MGALFLDNIPIGDDGRCAYLSPDQHRIYAAHEAERRRRANEATDAVFDETKRIMDFMANDLVSNEMASAQIAYWTANPTRFWDVVPDLRGILHPELAHAKLLRHAAGDLLARPFPIQFDYRDAHALRLWADRLVAEAQANTEAA